jgi:Cu2+-exporting ATPase
MKAAGGQPDVVHELPGRVRLRLGPGQMQPDRQSGLVPALGATPGVLSVRINTDSRSLIVDRDPALSTARIRRTVRDAPAAPPGPHPAAAAHRPKNRAELLPIAAGCLLAATGQPLALPALALAGLPIFRRAARRLRRGRVGVDLLDSVALGATLATGQAGTAAALTALIELGEWMREFTASRSRRALGALMHDPGATAWRIEPGRRVAVLIDELRAGDVVVVHPGDRIPVDGLVVGGAAEVDERFLTGEPAPIVRRLGDRVFAMTVVVQGELRLRAEAEPANSRAGQIVRFLEAAPMAQTRMSDQARRYADRFVLPTLALAGGAWVLTGSLSKLASIVIFDFATGIRVAAPTTMLAALLGAAREGILVKGAATLERLATVDAVIFDKTGTLTGGRPQVARVVGWNGLGPDGLIAIAAAADRGLNHPVAVALAEEARRRGVELTGEVSRHYHVGLGVEAELTHNGRRQAYLVGSRHLLEQWGIQVDAQQASLNGIPGVSRIFVADRKQALGAILLRDSQRSESAGVITALRSRGIRQVILLTGDSAGSAELLAGRLGVDAWHARATPQDKAAVVTDLRSRGHTVAVVGDGINDSMAFALADVSIAMGGGSDLATSTAQVVLVDDDLNLLPRAIDRAHEAMEIMRQNLALIAVPNAAGLTAAAAMTLNPALAALISNGSTILAAGNGLRPLARRSGGHGQPQAERS